MHKRQSDRYYVHAGDLRCRPVRRAEGSPTKGSFCQFFFTEKSHGLLQIPAGVWHATQNWGTTLAAS